MNTTSNKTVLITGGSRGLGKDMALRNAENGNHVIITYRSKKAEADEVVQMAQDKGVRAAALQLDVSDTGAFGDFVDRLKDTLASEIGTEGLDYLVNNAGIGIHKPFTETSEEEFDTLVDIHFKGAFFLTQRVLPLLRDGGGIVNVSTGLARFSIPGYAAYAAMKGAMETLTQYQAKELGARGIRANIVAPGAIETDFGGGAVRDNRDLNAFLASQTALGRVGKADDIGSVVAFLCSDAAQWVNAQRIEASGGMFL